MDFNVKSMPCRMHKSSWLRKSLNIMRCIVLFILLGTLQTFASLSYSQSVKLSLNMENTTVQDVLSMIEQKCDFYFTYNLRQINATRKVSVHFKNKTVTEVLDELFAKENIYYVINDKHIALYKVNGVQVVQQTRKITGMVTDKDGEPIPGANIVEKGSTTNGTITDMNGRYSLSVPANSLLIVSYIGYNKEEIAIKNHSVLDIILTEDTQSLEEVVVVGYGTQKKVNLTGSVSSVNYSKSAASRPLVDATQALGGVAPGLQVMQGSGNPYGESYSMNIRGVGTLNDSNPLILVDGMEQSLSNVNPIDIESISVLKDAASCAIYGNRGANGVILITTKTAGKKDKVSIDVSSKLSLNSPMRVPKLVNNYADYMELINESYTNLGRSSAFTDETINLWREKAKDPNGIAESGYPNYVAYPNTDWYDELFRNSVSTTHNLSINGGGDKYTYYTSLAYTRNAGLLKNNDYDRYNLTANLSMHPSQKVKIDFGASMSYQYSKSPALNSLDPFQYAYFANPYESPYNEDGSYRADETYYALGEYNNKKTSSKIIPDCGFNVLREMDETSSRTKNIKTMVRAGIDYSIINHLRFVGLASYTYSTNRLKEIYGDGTKAALDNRMSVDYLSQKEYASVLQRNIDNDSYMIRGHFAYDDQFGSDHAISLIAGAELRGNKSNGLFSKRYGYASLTGNTITPLPSTPEGVNYDKLKEYLTALDASSGETWNEQKFASFYASADYYYKTKYILNASFRTDGSSNFGSDQQFNPNWAAGAAWNISEENFMQSIKPVLNRLTLRLATGFTGNISRAVSPQLIINLLDDYRNVANNVYHIGSISSPPNPNLRWEKTKDMKVALDFGLFNDRLTGIIEGYYRKTTDMVTSVRVLTTTGYSKQQYNTANVENKGIEATLNGTPVKTKDFTLSLSGNIAYNMNRITRYKDPLNKLSYAGYWEGYPMEAIYSGRLTGIDPDTGLYSFQLRPDAEINTATDLNKFDNYQFYLGTGEAPITGGFNITAEYKGVRLSVNGTYATGSKVLEYIKPPVSYQNTGYGTQSESTQVFENDLFTKQLNVPKIAGDRWTPNNTDGTYPRVWNVFKDSYNFGYYNPMDPNITRGAYLTNLSYVRIKSIIVGYSLPKKLLNQTALSNVDFSMALNNFFTFTSYKGMDPETPGATYPVSRSVMFSVNVGF